MESLLTLILVSCCLAGNGNPVFTKLYDVNKCWAEQGDIDRNNIALVQPRTETEWIQLHLQLVERTLRSRSTSHLSASQKQNRLAALDYLHQYWTTGRFPQNEEYNYRLPIFIDKYDNFCAVGYLVKATGYEHVSRMISANTNLAYVCEMNYPELNTWADAYGFTVNELAWIQPTYGPKGQAVAVGKGTNGIVYELFSDDVNLKLYVGGAFTSVDSTIAANNIAYVTESNGVFTWHNMGTGVNGTVHAIITYNNKVFAAGSFTTAGSTSVNNVAYWDGTSWNAAGCIAGTIKELIVYKGDLYAAGDFDVCAALAEVNFAKWTGNGWQQIPGLTGHVNTMELLDTMLLLGGAFTYNNAVTNAIKWNPNTGFKTFSNQTTNEVKDFEVYHDTVYMACKFTSTTDSFILRRLYGNAWDSVSWHATMSANGSLSFNTLCYLGEKFMLGGNFYRIPMGMGYYVQNNFDLTPWYSPAFKIDDYFTIDSTVNKMTVFKGMIMIGGAFRTKWGVFPLGGMARFQSGYGPPPPPPVKASASSYHSCQLNSDGWVSVNVTSGTPPFKYLWSTGDTSKSVTDLPAGTYTVAITDSVGLKTTATVTVSGVLVDTSVNMQNIPSGTILSAVSPNVQCVWYDCDNKTAINGQILKDFKPDKTGNYALIATYKNCSDTSSCYYLEVKETSVARHIGDTMVKIYPNPIKSRSLLRIEHATEGHMMLYDMAGKLLLKEQVSAKTTTIDIPALNSGIYLVEMNGNDGSKAVQKLVIE